MRFFTCISVLFLVFCNGTEALLDKGAVNLQLGDFVRARCNFEKVVDLHPANAKARLGLGQALLQQWVITPEDTALLSGALVQLEAARTLHAGEMVEQLLSTVWYQWAKVSLRARDTLLALKAISRSISLDPKATGPLNMAAIIYFHRGERKKALDLFNVIITIDTLSVSGYFNKGMIYWADSNYQSAAESFFEAARRSPDDQEILRWAALAKKYTTDNVSAKFRNIPDK